MTLSVVSLLSTSRVMVFPAKAFRNICISSLPHKPLPLFLFNYTPISAQRRPIDKQKTSVPQVPSTSRKANPTNRHYKIWKSTPLRHRRTPICSSYYSRQQNESIERNEPAKKTGTSCIDYIYEGERVDFYKVILDLPSIMITLWEKSITRKRTVERRRRWRLTAGGTTVAAAASALGGEG